MPQIFLYRPPSVAYARRLIMRLFVSKLSRRRAQLIMNAFAWKIVPRRMRGDRRYRDVRIGADPHVDVGLGSAKKWTSAVRLVRKLHATWTHTCMYTVSQKFRTPVIFSNNSQQIWPNINPCPGNGFLRRLPATGGGGKNTPMHISSSGAHSEKIPTATPTLSGSRI